MRRRRRVLIVLVLLVAPFAAAALATALLGSREQAASERAIERVSTTLELEPPRDPSPSSPTPVVVPEATWLWLDGLLGWKPEHGVDATAHAAAKPVRDHLWSFRQGMPGTALEPPSEEAETVMAAFLADHRAGIDTVLADPSAIPTAPESVGEAGTPATLMLWEAWLADRAGEASRRDAWLARHRAWEDALFERGFPGFWTATSLAKARMRMVRELSAEPLPRVPERRPLDDRRIALRHLRDGIVGTRELLAAMTPSEAWQLVDEEGANIFGSVQIPIWIALLHQMSAMGFPWDAVLPLRPAWVGYARAIAADRAEHQAARLEELAGVHPCDPQPRREELRERTVGSPWNMLRRLGGDGLDAEGMHRTLEWFDRARLEAELSRRVLAVRSGATGDAPSRVCPGATWTHRMQEDGQLTLSLVVPGADAPHWVYERSPRGWTPATLLAPEVPTGTVPARDGDPADPTLPLWRWGLERGENEAGAVLVRDDPAEPAGFLVEWRGRGMPTGPLHAAPPWVGAVRRTGWRIAPLSGAGFLRASSPSGRYWVGGDNGRPRLWDVVERRQLDVVPAPGRLFYQVAFAPDERWMAFIGDHELVAIELPDGRVLLDQPVEGTYTQSLVATPDGHHLLHGRHGELHVRSLERAVRTLSFPAMPGIPATGRVRLPSEIQPGHVWELEWRPRQRHSRVDVVHDLAIDADRELLAIATDVGVWVVELDALLAATDRLPDPVATLPIPPVASESGVAGSATASLASGHVYTLVFDPDRPLLIAGTLAGAVLALDLESGAVHELLPRGVTVARLALSRDGAHLAVVRAERGATAVVELAVHDYPALLLSTP